jgi:hypothetical protein
VTYVHHSTLWHRVTVAAVTGAAASVPAHVGADGLPTFDARAEM